MSVQNQYRRWLGMGLAVAALVLIPLLIYAPTFPAYLGSFFSRANKGISRNFDQRDVEEVFAQIKTDIANTKKYETYCQLASSDNTVNKKIDVSVAIALFDELIRSSPIDCEPGPTPSDNGFLAITIAVADPTYDGNLDHLLTLQFQTQKTDTDEKLSWVYFEIKPGNPFSTPATHTLRLLLKDPDRMSILRQLNLILEKAGASKRIE